MYPIMSGVGARALLSLVQSMLATCLAPSLGQASPASTAWRSGQTS